MTEPTPGRGDDPIDDGRADEDREISDVGLPGPGDDVPADDPEVALDEVFPPEDRA
jgi:hypothetical protein